MQVDPELEALCDFKLILVPKDALPQEQRPVHEPVSAPAASDTREQQQPQELSTTAPEQAPQPCGEQQAAGLSGENAETQQPQAASMSAATSNSQAAPVPHTGTGDVAAQQPSEERAAHGAAGSQASKRKLEGVSTEAEGAQSEEGSLSSKRPRTECDPEQAALLPGAAVIPVIRGVVAQHSMHLRHALANCKQQASMVLPCEDDLDVEAGKQVVQMMMALPATQKAIALALASSLPFSSLIRCVHFAVYLDAQVPMELAIDGLCLIPQEQLTAGDANAMLALPGAVQVIPALFDKVKGLCSQWLQHTFGNAARLFGSEQLKAELCSLELPAIQLFDECMSPELSREEVVYALVLWCSHPSCSACLQGEVLELFTVEDIGTMLSLPPESGARDVCTKWLLYIYKDVHEVVVQQELRSSFFELPFDAVCLWAEQDGLTVRHSENEVAVLLELYADAAKLSTAQSKQLGSLVHVSSMSYSFRHFVLPKLSLISAFTGDLAPFNAELDMGGMEGLGGCGREFPAAWVGSRQILKGPFSFECSFPVEKLASMLGDTTSLVRRAYSGPFFCAGFHWEVFLDIMEEEEETNSLGVFLMPTASGPIPAPSHVKACYSLCMKKAGGFEKKAFRDMRWFRGESGWGPSNAVRNVSSVEQLKEYLLDSEMHVKCFIHGVV